MSQSSEGLRIREETVLSGQSDGPDALNIPLLDTVTGSVNYAFMDSIYAVTNSMITSVLLRPLYSYKLYAVISVQLRPPQVLKLFHVKDP